MRASANRGHYYLELSERSDSGDVLAQARAVIWSRHAQALLTQFKQATGADLDAGIKVLLRARPVFKEPSLLDAPHVKPERPLSAPSQDIPQALICIDGRACTFCSQASVVGCAATGAPM